VLPPPPGADPIITVAAVPGLPNGLTGIVNPPPAAPADAAPAPAPPLPQAASPSGGRLEPAQLIRRTLPAYPALARQRALLGVVRLEAVVDEHGDVQNVKVLSGDAVLAVAAKSAVQTWKYKPAILNGQPIATKTEIDIVFGDRNK